MALRTGPGSSNCIKAEGKGASAPFFSMQGKLIRKREGRTIMNDELAVVQAAKEVYGAVNSMVSRYRSQRMVTRQQKILLDEKIRAFRAIAHTRASGEVFNSTINELAKAQRLIDSMDLHGLGYEMAMEQYRVLGEQLRRNLEEFTNGI